MKNIFKITICCLVLLLASCNAIENESTSSTRLILKSITGTDSAGSTSSPIIYSDVVAITITTDEDGNDVTTYSTTNDIATVDLEAQLIDPFTTENTLYQAIMVDQIDIEFSRSDGLTGQGVNVPYSFSQKVTAVIEVGDTLQLPFTIITNNAKKESPLVDLVGKTYDQYADILKLEAKVTIHGKDLGDHRVAPVVGYISIFCADFVDN